MFLIAYIGNRFGAFLKRILPKLFESFTPSENVREDIFAKSLRIFWQWIDLFDIKIYEYLTGLFGKDGDKKLILNSETVSENEIQTNIKNEEKPRALEINHLEKGLMLLFFILTVTILFSINNANNAVVRNHTVSMPTATYQPVLSDLLVNGTYTKTPVYGLTPHGQSTLDYYSTQLPFYKLEAGVPAVPADMVDRLYLTAEAKRLNAPYSWEGDQYSVALDYYNQAIKTNPRYAPSYLGRARVNALFDGQYHVLIDLNRAINSDDHYTEAYLERGMYFLSKNDPTSAKSDLQMAAKLNPNSPLVQLNLARVLLKLGENKAALAAAQKAKALDVTSIDAYQVLSIAYRANGRMKDADDNDDFLKTYDGTPTITPVVVLFISVTPDSLTYDSTPEITRTPDAITRLPKMPTRIPSSTVVLTSTPEPTSTPLPTVFADTRNVQMVLVPGIDMPESDINNNLYLPLFIGPFTMGSELGDADEKPVFQITLGTFYIDKYEVTNSSYKNCVESGRCQPPFKTSSRTHPSYYGNPQFDNYPVVYVDWGMAKAYCEWRNARLPSEAEWEKAARGIDARTYPWGESINKSYANYGQNVGDTKAVGSYESGKSIFGAYDMAGNVWEWVADWYIGKYFVKDESPIVPLRGDYRVLRGGSWYDPAHAVRAANREYNIPSDKYYLVGFRCARSFP